MACEECREHHEVLVGRLDKQLELLSEISGAFSPPRMRVSSTVKEDGTGNATVWWDNVPGGSSKVWLVERVVVACTDTKLTLAGVYVLQGRPGSFTGYQIPALYLADCTTRLVDIADEVHPVVVKSGETLAVQWQGLTVGGGASCTATVQYRVSWQGFE